MPTAFGRLQQLSRAAYARSNANKIHIEGDIGTAFDEFSAQKFREALELADESKPLTVVFLSDGGNVAEGFAIFDMVSEWPQKTIAIVRRALSIASFVAMAFDEIEIREHGDMMVHDPWLPNDDATEPERGLLDSFGQRLVAAYAKRTGQPTGRIRRMMSSTKFFDASEAVAAGFADRIGQPVKRKLQAVAKAKRKPARRTLSAVAKWNAAVDKCGSVNAADKKHPGLRLKMIAEFNKKAKR
jgi:ATP-dependent protease ClpP protease subunit